MLQLSLSRAKMILQNSAFCMFGGVISGKSWPSGPRSSFVHSAVWISLLAVFSFIWGFPSIGGNLQLPSRPHVAQFPVSCPVLFLNPW